MLKSHACFDSYRWQGTFEGAPLAKWQECYMIGPRQASRCISGHHCLLQALPDPLQICCSLGSVVAKRNDLVP